MKKVITVGKSYNYGTLQFYPQGQIGVSVSAVKVNSRKTSNKLCVLDSINAYSVFNYIASRQRIINCTEDDFIWIHPKARISRELVRQSEYSITRMPEKALFKVIPKPDYNEFIDQRYNIAFISDGELYLFSASDYYNRELPEDAFEKAIRRIKSFYNLEEDFELLCDDIKNKKCTFIPNIDIYEELLNHYENIVAYKYIFDTELQLIPNVNISVETLDLWRRMDWNMLAKFICASDWKEYPFTLYNFIEAERADLKYTNNNNMKMIIQEIGAKNYFKPESNRMVFKKDYEMLISYIFHLMNKEPKPCYVTEYDLNQLPARYRKYFHKKIAIAPVSMIGEEDVESNLTS